MPYISTHDLFSKRGNMSGNVPTEELQNKEHFSFSILPLNLYLAAFAFALTISFLSNLKVICVVYNRFSNRTESNFSAVVLIAHSSLISIGITNLSMLNTFQSQDLLPAFGPLFRHISDFLEDSLICGFSLNIVLLVYELAYFPKNLQIFYSLGILWSLAITQGFFTMGFIWIIISESTDSKLGAQISGICCEIIRYFIFFLSVGCFVGFALFESRQLPQLPRRMRNIHIFRIHFSMLIIVWISYGLWNITYRFAFFLELDIKQYSILIEYIRLGFYTYVSINPMINLLFLDLETTNFPTSDLSANGNSKSNGNFKETLKELKYDDLNTTAKVKRAKLINEEMSKSTVFCVPVDVHVSFPAEQGQNSPDQLYLRNSQYIHDGMEIEKNGWEGDDERSSNEKQSKTFEMQTKVNFCDTVQINYYEKDRSDES